MPVLAAGVPGHGDFAAQAIDISSTAKTASLYARQGSRLAQVRIRSASSSPTNVSLAGSNVTLRPSIQAMAAAWQARWE